jgi:surface antigen
MATFGTSNSYPYGQCTWYANDQIHKRTGHYVPWMGDAHSWASMALSYGWVVSNEPLSGPQIVCLQPFVQQAGALGHVSMVESVMNAHQVKASSMNWGLTRAEQASVTYQTFTTGVGVTFIGLTSSKFSKSINNILTSPVGLTSSSSAGGTDLGNALKQLQPLFDWLNNPARVFKMLAGLALVGVSFVLLLTPGGDIKNLAKLAMFL